MELIIDAMQDFLVGQLEAAYRDEGLLNSIIMMLITEFGLSYYLNILRLFELKKVTESDLEIN